MLTNHLPPDFSHFLKVAGTVVAVLAAGAGWWAARLWLQASKVKIPELTEPLASASDAPAAMGGLYDVQLAYAVSGQLNARAAVWTGWAAALTGMATILGAI